MCAGDPIRPPCPLEQLESLLAIQQAHEQVLKRKYHSPITEESDFHDFLARDLQTNLNEKHISNSLQISDLNHSRVLIENVDQSIIKSTVSNCSLRKDTVQIRSIDGAENIQRRNFDTEKPKPVLMCNKNRQMMIPKVCKNILKSLFSVSLESVPKTSVPKNNLSFDSSALSRVRQNLELYKRNNSSKYPQNESKLKIDSNPLKSKLLKSKMPYRNQINKFSERLRSNFFKKINNKSPFDCFRFVRTVDRIESFHKCKLKRFKKYRKKVMERIKRAKTNMPMDASLPKGRSGSTESSRRGFTTSKNAPSISKRNSLPNLFCRGLPRPSVASVKTKEVHQELFHKEFTANSDALEQKDVKAEQMDCARKPARDTVKLIDKYLKSSPPDMPKYRYKQKFETSREGSSKKSLSLEGGVPFSAVRRTEIENYSKSRKTKSPGSIRLFQSVDDSLGKGLNLPQYSNIKQSSDSLEIKSSFAKPLELPKDSVKEKLKNERIRSLSANRPTSLPINQSIPNVKINSRTPETCENITDKMLGLSISLDGSNLYKRRSFSKKKQTSNILQRLDSVLTEIVEQEKDKIEQRERSTVKRISDSNFLSPIQQKDKIKRHRQKNSTISPSKNFPTPADILQRHKGWFTDLKPCNPRILKSDSQSKLLTMRCYQPPRPKRKKRKTPRKRKSLEDESYSASSDSCPASDSESQDKYDKSSFEEESSGLSTVSAPSVKAKHSQVSQMDDEDDTCYGSDQISSDLVEKIEAQAAMPVQPKLVIPRPAGEYSIDSAFTESREVTPDIQCSDEVPESFPDDNQSNVAASCEAILSQGKSQTSLVQIITDARKYLLEKIKESHSYSDNNINKLLHYYSRKWSHIPEREMKIIVRSIRSDLGVRAPPKECIEYLVDESSASHARGNSCQNLSIANSQPFFMRKDLSREDILSDLTTTLPEYLKVHQWNRKVLSTSSSPEPLSVLSAKEFSGNYSVHSASPQKSEDFISPLPLVVPPRPVDNNVEVINENDEEWIKKTVGEETFKEMEIIINEMKDKGTHSTSDPEDFEKMASELCKQFSITF